MARAFVGWVDGRVLVYLVTCTLFFTAWPINRPMEGQWVTRRPKFVETTETVSVRLAAGVARHAYLLAVSIVFRLSAPIPPTQIVRTLSYIL